MARPEIIIISALAETNRVIGRNGKLPWKLPEDSARFRRLTLGHTVIMGRKTWEFDVEQCPLKQRHNIVISANPHQCQVSPFCADLAATVTFTHSLESALRLVKQEEEKVFIVGGATIYEQALSIADTLELTLIEGNYEGDTFFPDYSHLLPYPFELTHRDARSGYRFDTYKRQVKVANSSLAATPELQKVG